MLRERFYNLISLLSYLSAFATQILPMLKSMPGSESTTHQSSWHSEAVILCLRTMAKRRAKACPWGLSCISSRDSCCLLANTEY